MLIAGEGLGSGKSGRADPVMAGGVKRDHLGVGATRPDEVSQEDDIYEQYKKRMMLGYRHRPNPLVCFISFLKLLIFSYHVCSGATVMLLVEFSLSFGVYM